MADKEILERYKTGDIRALSRMISLVENEIPGWEKLIEELDLSGDPIITGITGPPGAGKSTLINALIDEIGSEAKISILAVDPSSPFNRGSVLGDRLRMSEHFNDSNVYIRSLATRGALGGLSNKIYEVLDVLRGAGFDYILIETVGVGQSEVEIASMANTTVLVLVPESGDEVQTLKSGIMEIADIIVVNKSDREGADKMIGSVTTSLHDKAPTKWTVPVLKTTASLKKGIPELLKHIKEHKEHKTSDVKVKLLVNQASRILVNRCLSKIDQNKLQEKISSDFGKDGFNIYSTLRDFEK
ncbi:MAG: methylmalonyl Co-A mutase-associated GTPase MeaB [Bacteroidia bacterium]|nr:methylmalonyl Co-A mutase-associated GTPase MeaB [Bacteroidia bacterium]